MMGLPDCRDRWMPGCGCARSRYRERLLTAAFTTAAAAWGGEEGG